MENAVRCALDGGRTIEDTHVFAEARGFIHADLIGVCKSLSAGDFTANENISRYGDGPFRDLEC
jgi:hypothetical protein